MSKLLIFIIKIYQIFISPIFGRNCRFYPSCSEFAVQVIKRKGVKGIIIAMRRLGRCHPFNPGGYDPVENWIEK
ncbi:MAG TPA: membrane protein insertion efficiency factor YidD [Firmicutes bacterium]|nr:MAG: membrane protein insertion efficiency factor YidD [Candidatus Omnitrophota bacterium]HDD64715.1 membrane protein insertion efficiency factor YidD [Bacillota bacterium]